MRLWDNKLRTHRREAGFALSERRYVARGSWCHGWARAAARALERAERQTHKRLLSVSTRDESVLADVYGW